MSLGTSFGFARRKTPDGVCLGSAVSGQLGGQVGRALEVEQGVGKGFQLLQGQGLDLGGGGVCEGAAAADQNVRSDFRPEGVTIGVTD